MNLKSKAQTLKNLKLRYSKIPTLKIFKCEDFVNNKRKIINIISRVFKNHKLAIRSSFENEDSQNASNAGKFKSFVNLDTNNKSNLEKKITEIIHSKKKFKSHEEFFVQKMVEHVSWSGVVLTRNLENYSKCININYSRGHKTNIVTSGKIGSKSLIYFENKRYPIPKKFKKLYRSIREIKKIISENDLDIEFAVDKNGDVFILQVRKLIVPKNIDKNSIYQNFFSKLEKKINKLKKKHHDLIGDTTYFGVMPDWNPAEILGAKPRPLAISLYRELITDHIWSQNRESYGFKKLSQFHLMTNFYGTPYVDVRIDFNSWIPKNLDKKISEKIINYYLNKFNSNTSLHDKIEFEILFTCATFTTRKKITEKLRNILSKKEIKKFYKELTMVNYQALKQQKIDIQKIKNLIKKQKIIEKSNLYEIDKIYWLIEDCKKYGTIAFAGLARCGFIAIELLNSIEEIGAINKEEKIKFLANIKTITTELKKDFKKLNKRNFLNKYGHLRPGTYDINSKNYREAYSSYFDKKTIKSNKKEFKRQLNTNKIKISLSYLKIFKSKKKLFNFITQSIKYREYSKFVFTKSIDLVFKNLIKFGKKYKISRNDLSFIKINKIMDMYFNLTNYETIKNLKKHIKENKKEFFYNKNILLPDVVRTGKDLYVQHKKFEKISYISNKKTMSKIFVYNKTKLNNKYKGVICIENADPGYDFLFNKKIHGLITKYGGLNSHMAIRCAELNLPALIGVGEKNYNEIIKHSTIDIDCEKKKFELIN
ncbi:PEP-utilizing enzyme [Candidatus Pelagibacter sp.]|nr:PEP-utilizing enzyme [Candidatus Pelagibacter sp.]